MIRTALAVCAGLLCTLAGFRHASRLRQEAARLSAWTDAVTRLALLLQECALPLPEALRHAGAALSGPDRLLSAVGDAMLADPLQTLPAAFERALPVCAERDVLLRLAEGISNGSLERRCLACEQATAILAQLSSEARQRAVRDAKLWQTLGWTGGACLTLLLI